MGKKTTELYGAIMQRTSSIQRRDRQQRHRANSFRVLIIEDSLINVVQLQTTIKNLGLPIYVDVATTWEEGLLNLQKNHYDRIVIDWFLPDADGAEFILPLMNFGIPTVVWTGSPEKINCCPIQIKSKTIPVSDWLKPFLSEVKT